MENSGNLMKTIKRIWCFLTHRIQVDPEWMIWYTDPVEYRHACPMCGEEWK